MANTNTEQSEHQYSPFFYVCTAIAACLCYFLFRFFGSRDKKEKLRAFFIKCVCGFAHSKVFKREKTLLFELINDYYKKLKTDKAFTILEIGAGSGMNFNFFPNGSEVTCLEPNPQNEQYLRKNIKEATNNVKLVKFIKGVAENMTDVPDNSFDAVVSTFTMCHWTDSNAAIDEIRRVLKPDGKFFFLEHVAGERGSFLRFIQNILQHILHHAPHHGHLNRESWKFMENSKFKEVQCNHFTTRTWILFAAKTGIFGCATK